MHRVARELAHQECGWKHSEGHGVVALDYEGVRHVGLDKMCLLMEVRLPRYALPPSGGELGATNRDKVCLAPLQSG
jgi:hypothetical protein